jgi:serine/threonine-protein kinase
MQFTFDLTATSPSTPSLDPSELKTVFAADSVRFIGRGTFGETWAVTRAPDTLAVKVLIDPTFSSKRIAREINGLARVTSPHVVRLIEVNVIKLAVGPRLALVFEYIDGGDVWSALRQGRWPSEAEARQFLEGCLRGLIALHDQEVVHRDVKPQNIALRGADWARPVLLDLGLGRLLDESTLTKYPQAVGTAAYMAPEVVESRPAGKGADLWSLGVVLHLLLERQHPFYRDPAEVLDEDEAYQRLTSGAAPLPASLGEPLATLIPRLLSVARYERGSAARSLHEVEP